MQAEDSKRGLCSPKYVRISCTIKINETTWITSTSSENTWTSNYFRCCLHIEQSPFLTQMARNLRALHVLKLSSETALKWTHSKLTPTLQFTITYTFTFLPFNFVSSLPFIWLTNFHPDRIFGSTPHGERNHSFYSCWERLKCLGQDYEINRVLASITSGLLP